MKYINRICPRCGNGSYMVDITEFSREYPYKCINCNSYFTYDDFNIGVVEQVIRKDGVNKLMELKDTIELMTSTDWKDRFVAEYLQTKIRYEKLHKLIIKREVGKHGFGTPIPFESWKTQAQCMGRYLYELEKQAAIHGIELPNV